MASPPFSVRLSEDLKSRLEREAEWEDRSAGYLVQKAVEEFLDARDFFRNEMEAAIAEADKDVFVSGEAVQRWMESWDTENELPPPEPDIFPENDKP